MANKRKESKAGKVVWWLVLLIALGVFAFSAYQLITIWMEYKKGNDEYNDLKQYVSTSEEKKEPEENPEEVVEEDPDPGPEIDFAELKAINQDIIGWLQVEAIEDINYPIVQGKDNDYYLHRTFKDTYNFAGSIFLGSENKADFSDCNSMVYGHNMKNGSMFGQLKKFRQQEIYDTSRYFWICTPAKNYKYEIISAQEVSIDSDAYTLFSRGDKEFVSYMEKMRSQSIIPIPDTSFTKGDKIVTLSTCTTNTSTRFIVQGRRVK